MSPKEGRAQVPQHRQLADLLTAEIRSGRYAPGARLPTEAELCAEHGLSRGTVRQAMRRLEDDGLILRRPGAGTIVIAREAASRYSPFVTSTADIVDFARYTEIQAPETAELRADGELADLLRVEEGSAWFLVRGRRRLRGSRQPMCWSEHYMRSHLPYREELLRGGEYTVATFESQRIEQEVTATVLPADMAQALGAEPGAPALVISRRHLNAAGDILTVSYYTHPADRFRLTSVLQAADPTP
ncbi:GntR family transcriptional regulator [Nocardioides sp. zg-DK7169]|uniref:GntR family transcriptional regulator n=1 Tax=Nocardioides sp. zg-DK7169 TaxID=2736600 RepID=UPI0015532283|nr:GntR family transcriptional regulator [Nocardioides sp. zg-DK7169]NPC96677.1 GntR family transcriptional regulator [Nocardioides sp. zg-DK7169]